MFIGRLSDLRIVGGHLALDLANTVAPRPPATGELEYLPDPMALLRWAGRLGVIDGAEAQQIEQSWRDAPGAAEAALADVHDLRGLIAPLLTGHELEKLTRRWATAINRSALLTAGDTATPAGAAETATPPGAEGAPTPPGAGKTATPTGAGGTQTPAGAGTTAPATAESPAAPPETGTTTPVTAGSAAALPEAGRATLVVGTEPAWMIGDRLADAIVDLLRHGDLRRLHVCPLADGGCGWLFLDRSRNGSRRWCSMDDCGTHAKSRRLTERRRAKR